MAADLNSVVLVGRLTKDVEVTTLSSGTNKGVLNIAVNRSVKQGDAWVDEVSFFEVVLWGKTAEGLRPYLVKGKLVGVDGYLKQDRWEKDGQKHSKVNIVANSIQLLGAGKNENQQSTQNNYTEQNYTTMQQNFSQNQQVVSSQTFQEDIPF